MRRLAEDWASPFNVAGVLICQAWDCGGDHLLLDAEVASCFVPSGVPCLKLCEQVYAGTLMVQNELRKQ
jgi:uncharacterized protein YqkB